MQKKNSLACAVHVKKTPAKLQSSRPIRNGFRETLAINGVALPENGWLEYRIFRGSVSFREGTI